MNDHLPHVGNLADTIVHVLHFLYNHGDYVAFLNSTIRYLLSHLLKKNVEQVKKLSRNSRNNVGSDVHKSIVVRRKN